MSPWLLLLLVPATYLAFAAGVYVGGARGYFVGHDRAIKEMSSW